MKKFNLKKSITILFALILTFGLSACGNKVLPDSSVPGTDEKPLVNYADIIMFMGQSNMAGRGSKDEAAVTVGEGHAYEFRAVTAPITLSPLQEPFGVDENRGVMSENKKTGSLVSAFCEAYYRALKRPVIAVAASQGGTKTSEWQQGGGLIEEALQRLEDCLNYMYSQDEYEIGHIYMVWLQGESDAANMNVEGFSSVSNPITPQTYKQNTRNIINLMKQGGVEHAFLITIGNYSLVDAAGETQEYVDKKNAQYNFMNGIQREFCNENDDCTLVSVKLEDVPMTSEYMRLKNHHTQKSYDIVGWDAGKNTAEYLLTGNNPVCKPFDLNDYSLLLAEINNQG